MTRLDVALWGLPDDNRVKDPMDDGVNVWYSTIEAIGENSDGIEYQIWQRARVLNKDPEEYIEQEFALVEAPEKFLKNELDEQEAVKLGISEYGIKWMCWTSAMDKFIDKIQPPTFQREEIDSEIASRIKDRDDVTEILAAYEEVFGEPYKQ